ncbi:acyl-ACP--UDP-N-acetylglucosamine O-acyltransferase [Phenylobacterium terrae]|uniref:Acyl-ACP--UDP-N-acetylglucosamine O-acyltransferase n=1 Tax=Phenylobacterium terrae TaxID=2665495 RepID=A0ABW4N915_9CAUL
MSRLSIHPTAVVAAGARLGPGCRVHPFAVIGPDVSMGPNNEVHSHAVIEGRTEIGAGNVFHTHCHVGGAPQHAGWRRDHAQHLRIGDDNVIGEYASVSGGSHDPAGGTRLGDRNLLMAYAHVGHDCVLANDIRMANAATLAGHVQVHDRAWLSGHTAVHQFVRIGEHAFVAGGAIVTQDVPPYCLVQGDRARLVALNHVGLTRSGVASAERAALRLAFRMLFLRPGSLADRIAAVREELGWSPSVARLVAFLQSSERGCITAVRHAAAT